MWTSTVGPEGSPADATHSSRPSGAPTSVVRMLICCVMQETHRSGGIDPLAGDCPAPGDGGGSPDLKLDRR